MITYEFTICKTNIELNTMLETQDINDKIEITNVSWECLHIFSKKD